MMPINRRQSFLLILNPILVYLSAYIILGRRRGVGRGNGVIRVPRKNWDVDCTRTLLRFYIISDCVCHDQLRMRRSVFHRLCCRLRTFGLVDTGYVVVEEQVAMFLLTVGHDQRIRNILMQFYRSGQTVSHFFHLVLNALIQLYCTVGPHATEDNSPGKCQYPVAWHDYFKDAVGVVDGTHILTKVPIQDQQRYRNRKGDVSQNVLVACTFDMKFTFVLTGWEGSAHDGKLLRCAVNRQNHRLLIPRGKYYLADVGFGMSPGFLTPYRGGRYHLNDHGNPPTNARELLNFRHSSLQNAIERTIGVLKSRFVYLRNAPHHDVKAHARVILACCGLHNWLRDIDPNDVIFTENANYGVQDVNEEVEAIGDTVAMTMQPSNTWNDFRD